MAASKSTAKKSKKSAPVEEHELEQVDIEQPVAAPRGHKPGWASSTLFWFLWMVFIVVGAITAGIGFISLKGAFAIHTFNFSRDYVMVILVAYLLSPVLALITRIMGLSRTSWYILGVPPAILILWYISINGLALR